MKQSQRKNQPAPLTLQDQFEVGAVCSLGLARTNNEDSLLASPPLFAVADGMGGHEAGEVASRLAIEGLKRDQDSMDSVEQLYQAILHVNADIYQAPDKGIGRPGMGTTITAALIARDRLWIAQVGDSRAYLLRDKQIYRLTRDHSLVEEMIASGMLSEEQARNHPKRSIITKVLGYEGDIEPDTYEMQLQVGDQLLLCSDGLHNMITDELIRQILLDRTMVDDSALMLPDNTADAQDPNRSDAQLSAEALVTAANQAGGLDNISVVLVKIKAIPADGQPVFGHPANTSQTEAVTEAPVEKGRQFTIKKHRLFRGVIAFILIFVLVVGMAVAGIWIYASNSAFLIDENGQVVVYRGLNDELLGFKLQWREADTGIAVDELPTPIPDRLHQGIQVGSLQDANKLLDQYRQQLGDGQ